ncbi:DUF397 domain-containing protein [Streptomyces sp. NPDC018045]|uniref:DUF397 domain-containing protein n=1 Tax=Streptomyces sp. NPDC018045 TaxID=3365037 RepID=UPI003791E529
MPQVDWRKSPYSTHGTDGCAEATANSGGPVRYRESDRPGKVAQATSHTWSAFLRAVKSSAYE